MNLSTVPTSLYILLLTFFDIGHYFVTFYIDTLKYIHFHHRQSYFLFYSIFSFFFFPPSPSVRLFIYFYFLDNKILHFHFITKQIRYGDFPLFYLFHVKALRYKKKSLDTLQLKSVSKQQKKFDSIKSVSILQKTLRNYKKRCDTTIRFSWIVFYLAGNQNRYEHGGIDCQIL